MIFCTLDDKVAYPNTSEKIKVTYENPYVKDSGSYTFDITFPMAIARNRVIFKNVQRMDVKKHLANFETCRLYAGNRLIMSGKGTVTSITPDKVKVQIVGGKSRIKYNSKFEKHYIDKIISWGDAQIYEAFYKQNVANLKPFGGHRTWSDNIDHGALKWDMTKYSFLGIEGMFSFNPILNTDTDIYSNVIMCFEQTDGTWSHVMMDLALQPWLMFVLKQVLAAEGYTLSRNDFDVYPWNRLVIANAEYTSTNKGMRKVLPHMTVYTFLENVRKLLGGSFVFDEVTSKVSFVKKDELSDNDTVSYDTEDEFQCEPQDDALESMETSNVKYNFDDTSYMDWKDVMSDDILDQYDLKNYSSLSELETAAAAMDESTRYRTIFCVNGDYYVYRGSSGEASSSGGGHFGTRAGSEETSSSLDGEVYDGKLINVGFFNPVIREEDSDDYEELNILPAPVGKEDKTTNSRSSREDYYRKHITNAKGDAYKEWFVPKAKGNETVADDSVTVYEAMLYDVSNSKSETESDDERLYLFFQSKFILDTTNKKIVPVGQHKKGVAYMPLVYADYRQLVDYAKDASFDEKMSLSFKSLGITGRTDAANIDSHDEIVIKFVADDIPDPSKIYIFHNKRYICSKVEMTVTDDGIDKVKTGYFYEIL